MSGRAEDHHASSTDRLEHELRHTFAARAAMRRQRQRRVRDTLRSMIETGQFRRCSHETRSRLAWLRRELDAVIDAEDA